MTKFKLGMAVAAAAVLAFGVAACGQTTATTEEAPAVEEAAPEAAPAEAPADAAATTEAPAADGAAAPATTTP